MILKKLLSITFFVMLLGLSSQGSASLMLETYLSDHETPDTIGGYSMTDFDFTGSTSGISTQVAAPGGGFVVFSQAMNNNTANSTTPNNDANPSANASAPSNWWVNGEDTNCTNFVTNCNYDIYTTDRNTIVLTLPVNTLAFSFSVGANLGSTGNNAWLLATETDGLGIHTKQKFNVSRSNTPGFGIYADNSGGSCSTVTSIEIEPLEWGTGNFSISQGSCDVPEPSIMALFAAGLIGLGFARRRKHI